MFGFSRNLQNGALAAAAVFLAACEPGEPASSGGPPQVRLLTEAQYRNTIGEIFGTSVAIVGRFDRPQRESGLLAIGAGSMDVTPSALQRYDAMARSIANQAMDRRRRAAMVPCQPASTMAADSACARAFLGRVGRLLYRRPLREKELTLHTALADKAAAERGDFYAGLSFSLAGMLVSPSFLFVADVVEPDPDVAGAGRLDAFSKASRLSFLLWNAPPDDALLAAAESRQLHDKEGLNREIERMLASPKLEAGVRTFFSDMFALDNFETLAKDSLIYPAFSTDIASDAREQTLKTIVDHLLTLQRDYRDLFTTRETFMSRLLALVSRVPIATQDNWVPYTLPADGPRAGIQTLVGFTSLHSHPGRSSPTLRGKAVRELLMCQTVPTPPADVDFGLFLDPKSGLRTGRDRLLAHSKSPACAGCHKIMDPIGLTLEHFDGLGQHRIIEDEATIDVGGELDGVAFNGAVGLGAALRDNPAVPACLVNRLYAYATGHPAAIGDKDWLRHLENQFVQDRYRFPDLLRRIVASDAFFKVSGAAVAAPAS